MKSIKKLYRSRDDRVISGVCGGLGEFFKVDPVLFRIIFLIIALPGGISILVYFICWILMPLEPMHGSKTRKQV